MKKLFIALSMIIGFQFVSSAQFTIGAGAAFVFPSSSFGFQAKSLIGINDKVDFSPSVGIFLESGTPFVIDADVHYDLLEIGDGFRLMPFAGLNFINNDGSDLGINIGASIRFDINANTIYIEPKYTVLSYNGMTISAGILF